MFKYEPIDWDALPAKLTLRELSELTPLPLGSLRQWARVEMVKPCDYKKVGKGQKTGVFNCGDVRVLIYELALTHGWLGYKRCQCGNIYEENSSGLCRKCIKKKDQKFAREHPERRNEYARRTVAKRPEHYRLKGRLARSKRRAIEKGAGSSGRVVRRDWTPKGKRCYWCDVRIKDKWHFDHVMPLKLGGAHESYNMVVSCPACNMKKGAKHPNEFTKGQGELVYE